ncbi:MAG: hypothetical protein ACI9HK_004885, partial [Pirellulaceae bacterium]
LATQFLPCGFRTRRHPALLLIPLISLIFFLFFYSPCLCAFVSPVFTFDFDKERLKAQN